MKLFLNVLIFNVSLPHPPLHGDKEKNEGERKWMLAVTSGQGEGPVTVGVVQQ